MKYMLGTVALLAILVCTSAQAQKKRLKGKVIDAVSGMAVGGATITIDGDVVVANENGVFEANLKSINQHDLLVSSIGYVSKHVDNLEKGDLTIALEPSSYYLEPLEIKALRASNRSPFTKTDIRKEQIAKDNLGQDIPILLSQTPSVVVNSDAGNGVGYTAMFIRGVDATRTNVTLNGIPYNDAESQGSYFVDLPDFASSLSSIQIQRGVGTSTNGSGAFGASLNLQTNEFIDKPYFETNNSYGSFNTIKNNVKFGTGLFNNHFTIDGRLSRIKSDGYIDRASSDLKSLALSAAYIDNKTSLRLNFFSGKEKTYQAWNGVPQDSLATNRTFNAYTYSNQTDNYQQDHYQFFVNHSLSKTVSLSSALFYVPGKGYYEQFLPDANIFYGNYYSTYNVPNPIRGKDTLMTTDLVRQRWLDNDFYGGIFSGQYKEGKNQVIVGGGLNTYEGRHFGNVVWAKEGGFDKDYQWYWNQAQKTDGNVYAKWEHSLTKEWLITADLQYKTVRYRIPGFDFDPGRIVKKDYGFFNPKAGVSYQKDGWNLYASYAVANKEPNRTDFEKNSNNYNPESERLNDLELNIGRSTSGYAWSATFYDMNYKDQLVPTGNLNDVGSPIRINVPKSFRRGLELQGQIKPIDWLSLGGNLTVSSNKIKDFDELIYCYDSNYAILGDSVSKHSNTDIAFSSKLISSLFATWHPCSYFELGLTGKYVEKQFLDNTQSDARVLPSYFVQNLKAILTLKTKTIKSIDIIAQVNNLSDLKYESNGYTYNGIYSGFFAVNNYYYPMAGRNYMLGLNIKL